MDIATWKVTFITTSDVLQSNGSVVHQVTAHLELVTQMLTFVDKPYLTLDITSLATGAVSVGQTFIMSMRGA